MSLNHPQLGHCNGMDGRNGWPKNALLLVGFVGDAPPAASGLSCAMLRLRSGMVGSTLIVLGCKERA